MRPSSGGGYSHIQIVTKHIPESHDSDDNSGSPPLTFRSPSLTQEAEAALEFPLANLSTNSPESLAKNLQGPTFAAKARAAELRAARARRAMKAQNSSGLANPPLTPHEIMTFKSRSKSSRTWKRIDLSNLPGVGKADGTTQGYLEGDLEAGTDAIPPDTTETFNGTRNLGKEVKFNQNTTPFASDSRAPSNSIVITDAIKNSPRLSYSIQKGLSPTTEANGQQFGEYELIGWSPKQRSSGSNNELHEYDKAEGHHVTSENIPLQSITPISTFAGSLDSRSDAGCESKMPTQKSSRHQPSSREHPSLMPPFEPVTRARRSEIDHPYDHQYDHQYGPSQELMTGHRPTDDYENTEFEESGFQGHHFNSRDSYKQHSYLATLPSKPPHQYPAVKGTMSKSFQFPVIGAPQQQFGVSASSASGQTQQSGYCQSNTENFHSLHPDSSETTSIPGRTPSGSAFTEASRQFLLQKLHHVAESANMSDNSISRSVMHDPYAVDDYFHANTQSQLSSYSESSLWERSDALPWKERPVEILTRPSVMNCDYPILFGHIMRPDGCFPAKGDQNNKQEGQNVARTWWNSDNRFNMHGPDIALIMSYVQDEQRKRDETLVLDHTAPGQHTVSSQKMDPMKRKIEEKAGASSNALGLLAPALANLAGYGTRTDYFHKFGEVPEWCRDHNPRGNQSFFGEDWGAPPQRLGRDPRYRPFQHEGRAVNHSEGGNYRYPDTRSRRMHADARGAGKGGAVLSNVRSSLRDDASPSEARRRSAALEWQDQDFVRWKPELRPR